MVIAMQAELGENLVPITGAGSEVRDAVTNLLLNAIDAIPEGGTLSVRSFQEAESGA